MSAICSTPSFLEYGSIDNRRNLHRKGLLQRSRSSGTTLWVINCLHIWICSFTLPVGRVPYYLSSGITIAGHTHLHPDVRNLLRDKALFFFSSCNNVPYQFELCAALGSCALHWDLFRHTNLTWCPRQNFVSSQRASSNFLSFRFKCCLRPARLFFLSEKIEQKCVYRYISEGQMHIEHQLSTAIARHGMRKNPFLFELFTVQVHGHYLPVQSFLSWVQR